VTPDTRVRLGPLELPSPIVAASGTFGHGAELARLCDPAQLGAVTGKSQAPFAWAGNPPPRLAPTPVGMLNSVGLQGPGVDHWVAHDLPALHAAGARVIASLWGHHVEDFAKAADALRPVTDLLVAVELNVSCPNLAAHGQPFAYDATQTAAVVTAVAGVELALPLFAKLAPDVADLPGIATAALAAGATGLTLVNTVRALLVDPETRRPVLGGGTGGLSGPALKPIALRAVHAVAAAHPGAPIIGTGGVSTGPDAAEMLLAGAAAVGIGTATFREPRAMLRIQRELEAWCAHHGVERVADLTGALRAADREEIP
jgi:dihydroorotate dehydrogenase (NAD+) catalytic subunit